MSCSNHGRLYFAVAILLAVFFLVMKFQSDARFDCSLAFLNQFSRLSKKVPAAIANDTLGFEKIFVINAPWRSDRKDSISLAASYSGISLDWIDGIDADDIREKAYPPGKHRSLPHGNLGSWRAHMNALREIIQQNLTTALILEDDADWDFRIRSQLADFSRGARSLPELAAQSEKQSGKQSILIDQRVSAIELARQSSRPLSSLSTCNGAKEEPYGRAWDVLWLGHCGASLPPPLTTNPDRILIPNDPSVPQPHHLKPMSSFPLDEISTLYPPHTRVMHRANTTTCTIGYAVTQRGARKLLYEFGIREFSKGYDFALSDWCNGLTRGARREMLPMCLTVQPPIFSHHFAERATSDITGNGAGGRPVEGSRYVRWSVKMNLERLVRGKTEMVEQWVDEDGNKE